MAAIDTESAYPEGDDEDRERVVDAWERSDREWNRPWPPVAPDSDVAPASADYQPRKSDASTITRAYGAGMRDAGPYLGLGAQIAGSMIVFVALGYAVDRFASTSPWGVLVGSLLGMISLAALVTKLVREANDASARTKEERRKTQALDEGQRPV